MGTRIAVATLAAALALGGGPPAARATTGNGTFRFLTQSLPIGTTNAEYVARLLVANADGPLTFAITSGSLPTGMAFNTATGFLTGRPTTTANNNITFTADDSATTIMSTLNLKVNAAGGGGNAGATFANGTLPDGRVGTAYLLQLDMQNEAGVVVFGAADLPPGLSLNGVTGLVTGTPTAPGTYFVSLSATDFGDGNKVATILPLTILPSGSDFRFTNVALNNGEVATTYCDAWTTANGSGTVTYSGSGLPPGLTVDPATGVVSGAPAAGGTFEVILSATDASDTITINMSLIIVPQAGSDMYWDFFGLPAALVNVAYNRQPPLTVAAKNGGTITYSAVGLPAGISYNSLTGELTGTASDVGEYPVTFTALGSLGEDSIQLSLDFLVLPPTGGDANNIPVNLWVSKETLKTGHPGSDSWTASCIYNADRRAGNVFDPATDSVLLSIGARTITVPPGSMTGTTNLYSYKTDSGVKPAEQVKVSPARQTLLLSSRYDTLAESVPATLRQTATVGGRGFRLDLFLDETGKFRPALGYRRTAFVCAAGKIAVKGAGEDTLSLALLLGDPNFQFPAPGTTVLRFRLLDGITVLVDRTFSELGAATTSVDPGTGALLYKMKTLKDAATVDRVAKFTYQNKTGKMALSLSGLTLTALVAPEAHLFLEVTVGEKIYFTSVTFFAPAAGKYSTKMPPP